MTVASEVSMPFLKGITESAPASFWMIYPYSPFSFTPKRKGVPLEASKLEFS